MINSWIFAGFSILLTGISQILLKLGAKKGCKKEEFITAYLNPYVVIAYGLFLVVTLFSVYALREIPLKVFYSFTAFNFLVVLALSHLLLKETVSMKQIFSVSLIILGIVIFNM